MTTLPPTDPHQPDDDLANLLRAAGRPTMSPTPDHVASLRQTLLAQCEPATPARPTSRARLKRVLAWAASTAAILAVGAAALLFTAQPSSVLADMRAAIAEQPITQMTTYFVPAGATLTSEVEPSHRMMDMYYHAAERSLLMVSVTPAAGGATPGSEAVGEGAGPGEPVNFAVEYDYAAKQSRTYSPGIHGGQIDQITESLADTPDIAGFGFLFGTRDELEAFYENESGVTISDRTPVTFEGRACEQITVRYEDDGLAVSTTFLLDRARRLPLRSLSSVEKTDAADEFWNAGEPSGASLTVFGFPGQAPRTLADLNLPVTSSTLSPELAGDAPSLGDVLARRDALRESFPSYVGYAVQYRDDISRPIIIHRVVRDGLKWRTDSINAKRVGNRTGFLFEPRRDGESEFAWVARQTATAWVRPLELSDGTVWRQYGLEGTAPGKSWAELTIKPILKPRRVTAFRPGSHVHPESFGYEPINAPATLRTETGDDGRRTHIVMMSVPRKEHVMAYSYRIDAGEHPLTRFNSAARVSLDDRTVTDGVETLDFAEADMLWLYRTAEVATAPDGTPYPKEIVDSEADDLKTRFLLDFESPIDPSLFDHDDVKITGE